MTWKVRPAVQKYPKRRKTGRTALGRAYRGIFRVNRLKEGRWGRRRKCRMEMAALAAHLLMVHLRMETEVLQVREERRAEAVQRLIMPGQLRSLPMIHRRGNLIPAILLMKTLF